MLCDIGDNTPRRLAEPVEVTCTRCGTRYYLRRFPLHAPCRIGDIGEFLNEVDDGRIGLGDVVAAVIKAATLGLVQPSPGCGCEDRRKWLNQWTIWKGRQ